MTPLVYYAVGSEPKDRYYYGLLRKSLTTLLRHYSGPVLIIADRDIRVPSPRVTVKRMPMRNHYERYEARLWIGRAIGREVDHRVIRALYLDVDTIITGSIDALFAQCREHGLYYATEPPDMYIGDAYNGRYAMSFAESSEAWSKKLTAYNSGVCLASLGYAEPLFDQIAKVFQDAVARHVGLSYPEKGYLMDQSALNTVIYRGIIKPIVFPPGLVGIGVKDTDMARHTILHFNGASRKRMDRFAPPEQDLIPIEGLE